MPRRIVIDPSLRNLDDWPLVAFTALPESKRAEYLRREHALRRYLSGDALGDIEKRTGLFRQQLYNLLRRCLAKHPDGRIYGFRGLLQYERVKRYKRVEPVPAGRADNYAGAAGAMTQLLDRYPVLLEHIRQSIKRKAVGLTRTGHVSGLRELHREFVVQCESLGIAPHQYPLNQLQKGKRTLSRLVKSMLNETFNHAARASGAQHISAPWQDERDASSVAPAALRPFDVVEFDGHKLDVRLRVRLTDPFGLTYDLELKRVWFLAIIDLASRAILGWHLALSSEYDRYDVVRTIRRALQPQHKRTSFSIPRLTYAANAGFASQAAPSYQYACWQWLRFDNARANLANDTLSALTEFVGCSVDAGPVATPNERPFIERFFGTISENLSHRLPGSTGSSPEDVKRALCDPGGHLELLLTFEELEELLDVTIANYNGASHSALGGRAPLRLLEEYAYRHSAALRQLSEYRRRHLFMLQPAHECEVRGNRASGKRPHINLFGAKYSGPVLTHAASLLNTTLHVYFDPQDMRSVQVFLPNGAELGALQASAPWHRTAHSLRLRREILRLKRAREITYNEAEDPVAIYLDYKRRQPRKRQRRSTHRIAEAQRALQMTPPAQDPRLPPKSDASSAKPRQLAIGDKAQST